MTRNNLRRIRRQQRFSIRGLSVAAHVSTATIIAVELYGAVPAARTRRKLAKALYVMELTIWPSLDSEGEHAR